MKRQSRHLEFFEPGLTWLQYLGLDRATADNIQRPFKRLVGLGVPCGQLAGFAIWIMFGAKAMQKLRRNDWTLLGMAWCTLKRFPDHLRETARQIERIK
jgi:hypothetical protein